MTETSIPSNIHELNGDVLPEEAALKRLAEIARIFTQDRMLIIEARKHPVHGPKLRAMHREAMLLAIDHLEPGVEPSQEDIDLSSKINDLMLESHSVTSDFVRDLGMELGVVMGSIHPSILMQIDSDRTLSAEDRALISKVEEIDDSKTASAFKLHPDLALIMACATGAVGGKENFLKIQMDITKQMQSAMSADADPMSRIVSILVSAVINAFALRAARPQFVATSVRLILELTDMSKSLSPLGLAGQWDLNAEQVAKHMFTSSVNHMTTGLPSDVGSMSHDMLGDVPFVEPRQPQPEFETSMGEDQSPAHALKNPGSNNSTMFAGNKTVN